MIWNDVSPCIAYSRKINRDAAMPCGEEGVVGRGVSGDGRAEGGISGASRCGYSCGASGLPDSAGRRICLKLQQLQNLVNDKCRPEYGFKNT